MVGSLHRRKGAGFLWYPQAMQTESAPQKGCGLSLAVVGSLWWGRCGGVTVVGSLWWGRCGGVVLVGSLWWGLCSEGSVVHALPMFRPMFRPMFSSMIYGNILHDSSPAILGFLWDLDNESHDPDNEWQSLDYECSSCRDPE